MFIPSTNRCKFCNEKLCLHGEPVADLDVGITAIHGGKFVQLYPDSIRRKELA